MFLNDFYEGNHGSSPRFNAGQQQKMADFDAGVNHRIEPDVNQTENQNDLEPPTTLAAAVDPDDLNQSSDEPEVGSVQYANRYEVDVDDKLRALAGERSNLLQHQFSSLHVPRALLRAVRRRSAAIGGSVAPPLADAAASGHVAAVLSHHSHPTGDALAADGQFRPVPGRRRHAGRRIPAVLRALAVLCGWFLIGKQGNFVALVPRRTRASRSRGALASRCDRLRGANHDYDGNAGQRAAQLCVS